MINIKDKLAKANILIKRDNDIEVEYITTEAFNEGISDVKGHIKELDNELKEYTTVEDFNKSIVQINENIDEIIEKVENIEVVHKDFLDMSTAGLDISYSTFTKVPDILDFSKVTNFNGLFTGCEQLEKVDINTDSATSMGRMFDSCYSLEDVKLSSTKNVTDMSMMFGICASLVNAPEMDTQNVTDMSFMFTNCGSLKNVPLYNTENVTNMLSMFSDCDLEEVPAFNTQNVTTMSHMFNGCSSLTTVPELNASKVSSNTVMLNVLNGCTNLTNFGGFKGIKYNFEINDCLNLTRESCINVLNGLYDFTGNGLTPSTYQGKLTVHTNFITNVGDDISIATAKGWTVSA